MSNEDDDAKLDALGNAIRLDGYVAVASNNALAICKVVKLCPKKIRVKELNNRTSWNCEWTVYPDNAVILDPDQVLVYQLKLGKN